MNPTKPPLKSHLNFINEPYTKFYNASKPVTRQFARDITYLNNHPAKPPS